MASAERMPDKISFAEPGSIDARDAESGFEYPRLVPTKRVVRIENVVGELPYVQERRRRIGQYQGVSPRDAELH